MITGCGRDRRLLRVGPWQKKKQSEVVLLSRFNTLRTTRGFKMSQQGLITYLLEKMDKKRFFFFFFRDLSQWKTNEMTRVPLLCWLLKTADIHEQDKTIYSDSHDSDEQWPITHSNRLSGMLVTPAQPWGSKKLDPTLHLANTEQQLGFTCQCERKFTHAVNSSCRGYDSTSWNVCLFLCQDTPTPTHPPIG